MYGKKYFLELDMNQRAKALKQTLGSLGLEGKTLDLEFLKNMPIP